jgi:hypothetical protein
MGRRLGRGGGNEARDAGQRRGIQTECHLLGVLEARKLLIYSCYDVIYMISMEYGVGLIVRPGERARREWPAPHSWYHPP